MARVRYTILNFGQEWQFQTLGLRSLNSNYPINPDGWEDYAKSGKNPMRTFFVCNNGLLLRKIGRKQTNKMYQTYKTYTE